MIKKVAVLAGGSSSERQVSLATADSVLKAIVNLGMKAELLLAEGDCCASIMKSSPDVVFIAMHGGAGEDGSVQGMLEVMGIPYTGSGVLSSSVCMNKIASKKIFEHHGLRVPGWQRLESPDDFKLTLPAVIKPVCGGSTIATSIVRESGQIADAFADALSEECGGVLAEDYIPGREVTVGVLEGRALPVLEIIPENGFYDYKVKYTPGMSKHILLEGVKDGVIEGLKDAAEKAFEAAWCSTAARVDFRLDGDNFYLLEINTIPGMTETSLLPKAARCAGISFEALILKIIEGAFKKKY